MSPIKVVARRRASPEAWDAAWRACPYATFFHSRAWADTWATWRAGDYSARPLEIEFNDGKRAVLAVSVEDSGRGWTVVHHASPGGTYGGWVSDAALTRGHARLLAGELEGLGNLVWRLNPFDPNTAGLDLSGALAETTQALDLTGGWDAVFTRWGGRQGSLARKARKAEKAGVICSKAETAEDWRAYFEAYEDSLDRWGEAATTRYPWAAFEAVRAAAGPQATLWLAQHEGRVIAGALCFYAAQHAVYWHGAARRDAFELRPVNLLMQCAVRDAAERGMRWFDFNPSGALEGVRRFKAAFRPETLSCPQVRRRTWGTVLRSRLGGLFRRSRG